MAKASKRDHSPSHHAFLLEEGEWTADGTYWEPNGGAKSMRGRARIIHRSDLWINESETVVEGSEEEERFENRYEVQPLTPGDWSTTWIAENPSLGRMRGTFSFVGDAILSAYESEDGRAVGHECLWAAEDGSYEDRGVLFVDGELASRWSVKLERSKA
ncbi:MAG: hypothetical protein R3326_04340 [Gemmatimonadota bacterium]|nr:hypothetical protein [Gemmatimonadota bacterium]